MVELDKRAGSGRLPRIIFSPWRKWAEKDNIEGSNLPGVYLLARFDAPPPGPAQPLDESIIYVGETCKNSLSGRWYQFDRSAFRSKPGHSGGFTYHKKIGDKGERLHVAAFSPPGLNETLATYFIRYVERQVLLDYVLRFRRAPLLNLK